MNFAVTGDAGFIGSHIVKRLVGEGHGVTVVDNLSRGIMSSLEGVLDQIDFVRMDICVKGRPCEATPCLICPD